MNSNLSVNVANELSSLEDIDDKKIISAGTWKNGGSYDSFIINLSVMAPDGWRQILQFHFWQQGSGFRLEVRTRIWGTWMDWVRLC